MLFAILCVKVKIMALVSMIMGFTALEMPTNSTDIGLVVAMGEKLMASKKDINYPWN